MAVLKANGSFLKANGKILVRPEGGLANFLYLTYFKNFNPSTFTDYPVIGGSTNYNRNPTITDVQYEGFIIPFAEVPYNQFLLGSSLVDVSSKNIFSIEFLVYASSLEGSASNSGIGIFNENNEHILAAALSNFIGFELVNSGIELKNNFTTERTYQNRIYIKKTSYIGVSHFAFVLDKTINKIKCYYQGELGVICNIPSSVNEIKLYQWKAFTTPFMCSQLTVRDGDCSINAGMNYPVPQTPYFSSILNN